MSADPREPSPRPSPRALGEGAIIGAAFIAMLAWTWFKWPDPLIDFGRELYLAWQVSQGAVLYRDVEHFNGPLSVWFNALLFRVFSAKLNVIAYANIVITAIILALLHANIRRFAGRFAATLSCLTFVGLFACAQFVDVGNYNFITPYSHELTHGIALSLGALWCLSRWMETGRYWFAVVCGALLGLVWLTKFEVFVACFAAVVMGMIVVSRRRHATAREKESVGQTFLSVSLEGRNFARGVFSLTIAMIWIPLAAFIALSIKLPFATAFRGVMGNAYYVFDSRLTSLPFYKSVAGFDDVGGNVLAAIVSAASFGVCFFLTRTFSRPTKSFIQSLPWPVLIVLVPPVLTFLVGKHIPWNLAFRGLPIVVGVALIISLIRRAKVEQIAFLVFALLLMMKIILAAKIEHYGFALAMPATLAVVTLLCANKVETTEAQRTQRRKKEGVESKRQRDSSPPVLEYESVLSVPSVSLWLSRGFPISVVLTLIVIHLDFYGYNYAKQPIVVATEKGKFFALPVRLLIPGRAIVAPSRGEALKVLLPQIEQHVPKQATLTAVPEGAMVNFLTGRRNPTPFVTLLPPEFLMFGSDRILAAYRANPPDFVVVVPTDVSQYGSRGFARDYGSAFASWIDENYREVPVTLHPGYPLRLLSRISR